jgi:hypothetical protein
MAADATPADPYATQKANIRDTVKYMAAAYAACGPLLVAGLSFANLGSLSSARLAVTVVAGAAAFGCILLGLKSILDILIGGQVFATTLGPAAKSYVDQHATELLSAGFGSYDDFLAHWRKANADVQELAGQWRALVPPAVGSPSPELEQIKTKYEAAVATLTGYNTALTRTVSSAQLYLLQERLRQLRSWLGGLAIVGFIALCVALWAANLGKADVDCSQCHQVLLPIARS